MMCDKPDSRIRSLHVLAFASSLALAACAGPRGVAEVPEPQAAPTPPPSTRIYFYPKAGQSPEQQDRDRYECYLWAMKQTGFDPSQPNLAPHQRTRVVPVPAPGHDTAVGAITGAAIGAAVSGRDEKASGAVLGAMTGAVIGAISDSSRQQQAQRLQERHDREAADREARIERQASEYRRAMAACLEGRGYSVSE